MAALAAEDAPEVSKLLATPRPWVSSRTASPTDSTSAGSTVAQAPKATERSSLSAEMSSAMTRAPNADASWVDARPTGPWPKIAIGSAPVSAQPVRNSMPCRSRTR